MISAVADASKNRRIETQEASMRRTQANSLFTALSSNALLQHRLRDVFYAQKHQGSQKRQLGP